MRSGGETRGAGDETQRELRAEDVTVSVRGQGEIMPSLNSATNKSTVPQTLHL